MDPHRQIRFLYPPFFFVTSILIGLWLDPLKSLSDFLPSFFQNGAVDLKFVIGIIAGGGVIILSSGYLIGTVSVFILTMLFLPFRKSYEACVNSQAIDSIKTHFKVSNLMKIRSLYLVASYDHAVIHPQIHAWLQRRWHAFNTSINSAIAVGLASLICPMICINGGGIWYIMNASIFLLLVFHAILTWCQTMRMIEFQTLGPFPKKEMDELNLPKKSID